MKRSQIHSPYMEWAKLNSGARYNLAASGVMNYPLAGLPVKVEELEINGANAYGFPPLIERIARHRGVPPEWVVTAQGTSMANHLAMVALLEPGDEVLIEEPTYELLLTLARYLGARVRRFARRWDDNFRLDPEAVRKQITPHTRLVVVTNLHNPSSALASESELKAIGASAREIKARVLVDEVYLEAAFEDPQRSAIHLGNEFVVTSSLTKGYGLSGLRCGWILAEPALARRIWKINDVFAATAAFPAEQLGATAFDNLGTVAQKAKEILAANRTAWNNFLHQRKDLQCPLSQLGTTSFPRLCNFRADDFCSFLKEKFDTSVVPGRFFEMPQHIRVGLCGDVEMTAEGLRRLGAALDAYPAHARH